MTTDTHLEAKQRATIKDAQRDGSWPAGEAERMMVKLERRKTRRVWLRSYWAGVKPEERRAMEAGR